MNRYAVLGDPIEHSLSPRIHEHFGRLTGRSLVYERRRVPAGTLAEALKALREAGGQGANITVPLKIEALGQARSLSARARAAGAVNTLTWDGEGWAGDNTDGAGLVRDLECNAGVSLRGLRVLLVGAGGAAQGVAGALLEAGIACLAVANRTPERAAQWVSGLDERARVADYAALTGPFDLVINATSAGLAGALPPIPEPVFGGAIVYDLVYGPAAQAFCALARACGARMVFDGLGMLVEQAAEAFWVWHGLRPPTAPVLRALRHEAR